MHPATLTAASSAASEAGAIELLLAQVSTANPFY